MSYGDFIVFVKEISMTDKCPWCSASLARDDYAVWSWGSTRLARNPKCYERQLSSMQPVVDAAIEWSTLSGSRLGLLLAIEKYNKTLSK